MRLISSTWPKPSIVAQRSISTTASAGSSLDHLLTQQVVVLAYADLFALTAVAAFVAVPLTFLFRGSTAGGWC